ncbi:hypothetical protein MJ1_0279 [Nanobdella aerobiophila]|uniref:Uncharacterized protein n=1 Tax=Nanobdella aerobiophila TaxID=2586965 RepID=A0A915SFJ9_9ARCH|nr:hypothetical protein [Nanobdella aerobiophila]BBL45449.1 hypothetical protein MJ1_0279 [Nanobdella aerobiophila]
MDFIGQVLIKIYNIIGYRILDTITQLPTYTADFIILIVFLSIGYVVSKITIFFTKIILNYLNIDNLTLIYKEMFFGRKLSNIIIDLLKYYIIIYFIILGLYINLPQSYILFTILNYIYISIIIVLVGVGIGEVISSLFKTKNGAKNLIKGLFIYIFLSIALSYIGLNSQILINTLYYFLMSTSISFGIIVGVIIALEYKDEILKLLK